MKRWILCCGVDGSDQALDKLAQTIEQRKPDGVLFAGGIRPPGSRLAADEPLSPDAHVTGLVFGGLHWDLLVELGPALFGDLLLGALARMPSDGLPGDWRDALLAADRDLFGGAHAGRIEALSTARGLDLYDLPPSAMGLLEDGIPAAATVPEAADDPEVGGVHAWVYLEVPGSRSVRFDLAGSSDVDLAVCPLSFPDPAHCALSAARGVSPDAVLLLPITVFIRSVSLAFVAQLADDLGRLDPGCGGCRSPSQRAP